MTVRLADAFGVGSCELVAFVGAGGKSTLLLGMGAELAAAGSRVLMTTTTKMGADQLPDWATVCRPGAEAAVALGRGEPVFVTGRVGGGKVTGVEPEYLNGVFAAGEADYVLVEADGARGRSLKAPASHEPVIPAATTLLVVIAGLDAVGARIADVAHRPERVAALTGRSLDDRLRSVDLALVLGHPEGGCKGAPVGARVAIALTKARPGPRSDAAAVITTLLESVPRIDRVVTIDGPKATDGSGGPPSLEDGRVEGEQVS